jgi:serine/threonine protein kinase
MILMVLQVKRIVESCCCPAFFIALIGPWICILAGVFVDYVVVEELTEFIWIGGHPYRDEKIGKVARMLAALGKGIKELKEFYRKVGCRKEAGKDPQRFFPFIRQFVAEGRVVNFSYKAHLFPKMRESHAKAIFLATIEDSTNRKVVVKFVQYYNEEAHRLLAAAGLAPELLYCSKEDSESEYLGELIMVVMEYVEGQTAHKRYGNKGLPKGVLAQVRKAVEMLHEKETVFGDLREPNIMVKDDGHTMLIDFDWCGKHGKHRYPVSLNDSRDIEKGGIDWHADVKRGGVMMMEHDIYRLNNFKIIHHE